MENKEFVFVLTHSYDAIERAAAALQLATNMAAFDAKIDFFLLNEGVHLARKGFAESVYVAERIFTCCGTYEKPCRRLRLQVLYLRILR